MLSINKIQLPAVNIESLLRAPYASINRFPPYTAIVSGIQKIHGLESNNVPMFSNSLNELDNCVFCIGFHFTPKPAKVIVHVGAPPTEKHLQDLKERAESIDIIFYHLTSAYLC